MKNKPKWVITDMPIDIKIKIWKAMKGASTYTGLTAYVARNPGIFTESEAKYLGLTPGNPKPAEWISRDTYSSLIQEIKTMPLGEVALLPEEIQLWARGLRGEKNPTGSLKDIIKEIEKHNGDLAEAANHLAENFKLLVLTFDNNLEDIVIGTDDEDLEDLENQITLHTPTRWLFSHMSGEFTFMEKCQYWGDLPNNEINESLIEYLQNCAAKKEFPGKCVICENFPQ